MEEFYEYSTYLLVKNYLAESNKASTKAKEIEQILIEDLSLSKEVDFSTNLIKEKLSKLYKEEKQKIDKFINISAWIFIVLTGLELLSAIHRGIFQILFNTDKPLFKKFYSGELNPIYEFYIQHPLFFYFLSLFIVLAMFFSSMGVLNRSNFARKIGVVLLCFKILQNLAEPLLVKFVYPRAYNIATDIPKSFADSIYQSSIIMSLIVSIVFVIIYGWLLYKYTNQDIVSEFT